jgi:hypothetical protein
MKRVLLMAILALAPAGLARAQTAPQSVSFAPARPFGWDLSGEVGWLSANKSAIAQDWNDWYDVASGGGTAGRYWTPHLKSEIRLAFAATGSVFEEQSIVVPGQPFPIFRLREHSFRTTTVGTGISYQFFENQWFHPSLGIGVDVVRETHRELTRDLTRVPAPEVTRDGGVSWDARPYLTTGFKWYVNERGFVRSDARVSFDGKGVSHVVWSAGIGVDL